MADYDINLPMYLVIRIHEAYPESQNVISEKTVRISEDFYMKEL